MQRGRTERRRRSPTLLVALAFALLLGAGLALAVSLLLGVAVFATVLLAGLVAPAVRGVDWAEFRLWWRVQTRPMGKGIAMASLNAVWPPLRRVLRPDFVWVMYAGVEAHKRAYFPPWVDRLMRPVFPAGMMRFDGHWGVIVSSLATAETLERSPEAMERLLAELRKQFSNDPPIALAGRLPSIAVSSGLELSPPFTKGDLGTVCSMAASAREAAKLVGKEPSETTLGVIGGKGFIGSKLVANAASEFGRTVALDTRYEGRSQGEDGVLYTNRPDDVHDAEAIIVLTPKGADMSTVASHLAPGTVVADDTHPEMPPEVRSQIEHRGATVLKATLGDKRFRFVPPIPDFRSDDIPGCILEALVIIQRGKEALESQELFNRTAEELGFRARLAPHLNATKPVVTVEDSPDTTELGDHAPLARMPRTARRRADKDAEAPATALVSPDVTRRGVPSAP